MRRRRLEFTLRVGCTFWTAEVKGATVPTIYHPDLPFEEVARALAHHNPEADVQVTNATTGEVIAVLRATPRKVVHRTRYEMTDAATATGMYDHD